MKWAIISLEGFPRWRHTSVIQGGGGGRGGLPLLIESYVDYISSEMFSTPRKRIREHMAEIFNSIKNYVQGNGSCPLPQSLSLADDQDL